ncbi:MAG: sulfite exporter TauE/SafE family protein [Burkholderiaceae bacterium]
MTFDPPTLLFIAATFALAGGVKGIIGMGLPTVSLALLTLVVDLPQAMALLLVPSFFTNLWQALVGGHLLVILRRLWGFLLLACATVWIGAGWLTRIEQPLLLGLLGVVIASYATLNLVGLRLQIAPGTERWLGPLAGIVNGLLTGLTGSFVVPGVLFMQSIGLQRDQLIQAMGVLFMSSTLALGVAMAGHRLLDGPQALVSAGALLPALLGMVLGQRLRRRLSESTFRRVFFVSLLVIGCYIALGALRRLLS